MYIESKTDTERTLAVEKILEDIPGGGVVEKDDLPTSSSGIKEGSLMSKGSDGIWHLTKTAMVANALSTNDTHLVVHNEHEFVVGDYIGIPAETASGVAITAITASGTGLDVITATWPGADVAASGLIVAVTGLGLSPMKYSPEAVAVNSVDKDDNNQGCGLMVRGRVRLGRMPYFSDATLRALLPLVRFV